MVDSRGANAWLLPGGMHEVSWGDVRGCIPSKAKLHGITPGATIVWDMMRYADTVNERAVLHPDWNVLF